MGLLSSLAGFALPAIGNFIAPGIGGAIGGALGGAIAGSGGSKQSGTQTVTQQQQIDPRIANILFGSGKTLKPGVNQILGPDGSIMNPDSDYQDNGGLLSRFQQIASQPQSAGLQAFGQGADQYLGAGALQDQAAQRDAASSLMGSNITAPQATAAQMTGANPINPSGMGNVLWNTGESYNAPSPFKAASVGAPQQVRAGNLGAAMVAPTAGYAPATTTASNVNAPSQNGLDLTGSYNRFVNGDPGANPFLTGAIQKGINQSSNAFGNMQADSTRNLLENVLPSIRGGAVIAGGYGGSRQGIAEGRALSDFGREQQRAASQFGQNNTDAAVAAQAGAYDADSNRALGATQGLGAQQYGVAQQDAAARNAASSQNAAAANSAAAAKFGADVAGAQANAGYTQQAGMTKFGADMDAQRANQAAGLTADTTNAGLLQDAAKTAYAGDLSAAAGSAGNRQQANLANQAVGNNAAQFNANQIQSADRANQDIQQQSLMAGFGADQQTRLANLAAQQGTNSLNSANRATGIGLGSGLLSGTLGAATNQNNYGMNRAAQESGLLAPYVGLGGSSTTSQPIYQNTGGNLLGGAAAGLGLYNQFRGLGGSGGGLGNFASNNAGLMNTSGLSLNDLLSAFGG